MLNYSSNYLTTMPMTTRRFKTAIYEHLARVGKSLASATRLELLDLLAQAPRTVESLAQETGQSVANTSQHLQVLRNARMVEAEKQGLYVRYRLADQQVAEVGRSIRVLAASRVAEIERLVRDFAAAHGDLEPVDQPALMARVARGDVTVVDVRPAEEYATGHIAGAISMPLAELELRLTTLPKRREVVAYCRGPYCVLAIEAVNRLRARGYRAYRMEAGVQDWRAAGRRIAAGNHGSTPGRPTRRKGTR